jgi:hypothetical protein
MALGPINYQMQVATPFESVLQGMSAGAKMADIEAARMQRLAQTEAAQQRAALEQQAAEAASRQQERVAELVGKVRAGTWVPEDFAAAQAFASKDQAEVLNKMWTSLSTTQRKNMLEFGQGVLAATDISPEAAKKLVRERIQGERNAGREAQAKAYEDWMRTLDLAEPAQVQTAVASIIGGLEGGPDALKAWKTAQEERRSRELQPAVLAAEKRKGVPTSIQEAIDFANLTPGQQKTFENLIVLRRPPPAVTSVNVTNLEKTASGELAKLIPDLYQQANSAAGQLADIPRYRAALDNAIVGPLAEQRLTVARIGNALGFTGEKAINATQELIQGNAEMALRSRSMLTGQGQITEGEQKLLIRARSGDINFSKGELQTLFSVFERASKAQYEKSVNLLRSASGKSETAQMFLDNVSPMPGAPESITVGGRTYKRPENFTDQQWADYKRAAGGQR